MISDLTLAGLRRTATTSLQDTCVRRAYSELRNSDDQEIGAGYADAETFACRFIPPRIVGGSQESATGIVTTRPRLRLPLSADGVFSSQDHVRITARWGVALAVPAEYALDGDPVVEAHSIVVDLIDVYSAPETP